MLLEFLCHLVSLAFCIGFYVRVRAMFGSSLPPVVCMRPHVLFTLFVYRCVQHIFTISVTWWVSDIKRL
jgi:uncharacterized membrane protein YGL010W